MRRLARELGVELSRVKGTGRKGRITKEDVQKAKDAPSAAPAAAGPGVAGLDLAPWPKPNFEKFGEVERQPLTRIQKISGPNLARNWVMIPHVTHNDEADITDLEAFRKRTNSEQSEAKVTMVALLAKAVVASLKAYPVVNSSLDGDDLVLKRYYNIGFAADTPNGLVVPVIKDADRKGVLEIAKDLTDLSGKARAGKLGPADMAGATFTISSLGGIGGTSFTPIVNAPEVAILGVTRSAMKPVWNGSEFEPRLMVPLSLSYDHRVIDGALAARFVAHLGGRALRPASRGAVMEVKVPDIGDFSDVPVIEVLVGPGDEVAAEDPLVVLESDKATMEVPSPAAGKIAAIEIKVGDKVSEGSVLMTLETDGAAPSSEPAAPSEPAAAPSDADVSVQVAVLGGGPGGYTAAFRAADLGLSVALIDRGETLGGVCLNVGCIPSKALLHIAKVMTEAHELGESGISFGEPSVDVDKVREWKNGVVGRLTGGLESLAKQRKVQVVRGVGKFTGPNTIAVEDSTGSNRPEGDSPGRVTTVGFEHCIIAAGSEAASLPFLPDDPRIVDSTGALEVEGIPERLLVIGGGIIGLEMATVYDALGSRVTVVELLDQLIPGADKDLIRVLEKRVKGRYEAIHLSTGVESGEAKDEGLVVKFGDATETFDRILVAVGRKPNGGVIGADAAGVSVDERGYVPSDLQMRTNVPHIFSIGDVRGEPMLAHKATHEGSLAAEVIAGEEVSWDVRSIPSVAYTDPEVAWTGLTETQAKIEEREVEIAVFPWAASGRALSMGRSDGMTKLVLEPGSNRVLGAGIVGVNAGELLAEAVLAIEAGLDAEDIALTIHAHPTLSETVGFSAEMAEGTITDIMPKRKRARA